MIWRGVESMQAQWDEMFGEKEAEVIEAVKVKKPSKTTSRKPVMEKSTAKTATTQNVLKATKNSTTRKKHAASKATAKKAPVKSIKSNKSTTAKQVVKSPAKKKSARK